MHAVVTAVPPYPRRLERDYTVQLIGHAGHDAVRGENLTARTKLVDRVVLRFGKLEADDLRGLLLRFLMANRSRRRRRKTDDVP